jgi:Bacterial Ig-like domain (group 3)
MWGGRRDACRIRFSVWRRALGALTLCAAVAVPVQLLAAGTAGASPTINFVLTGSASTGAASTTLSGTAFLDASVTPTAGSHIVSVDYDLLPSQPLCPPPAGNPCSDTLIGQGTPTLYGWLAGWDTTQTDNGTYQLEVFVEDVDASGTTYSDSSYGPISITVANPAPTTAVLIPSNGATVSGSQLLDASASCNNAQVAFEVTGPAPPPYRLTDQSVAPVATTPSLYGYLTEWNTANVPNGTYTLRSSADCFTGAGLGTSPPITITVDNPTPTTSVLIPSSQTTQSGTGALLDASASPNVGAITFELSGGTLSDKVVATATPTIYGWLAQWDTTTVPDGTYSLQSVASYPPPNGADSGTSSPVTISVAN